MKTRKCVTLQDCSSSIALLNEFSHILFYSSKMLLSLVSSKARSGSRDVAGQYIRSKKHLACLALILSHLIFSNPTTWEADFFVLKNVAGLV